MSLKKQQTMYNGSSPIYARTPFFETRLKFVNRSVFIHLVLFLPLGCIPFIFVFPILRWIIEVAGRIDNYIAHTHTHNTRSTAHSIKAILVCRTLVSAKHQIGPLRPAQPASPQWSSFQIYFDVRLTLLLARFLAALIWLSTRLGRRKWRVSPSAMKTG